MLLALNVPRLLDEIPEEAWDETLSDQMCDATCCGDSLLNTGVACETSSEQTCAQVGKEPYTEPHGAISKHLQTPR